MCQSLQLHLFRSSYDKQKLLLSGLIERDGEVVLHLEGRCVKARRECTRDDEWRLLLLTVGAPGQNCSARILAECYGGDAVRIQAPLDMHGSEAQELTDLLPGTSSASVSLHFVCETILVRSMLPARTERDGHDRCKVLRLWLQLATHWMAYSYVIAGIAFVFAKEQARADLHFMAPQYGLGSAGRHNMPFCMHGCTHSRSQLQLACNVI